MIINSQSLDDFDGVQGRSVLRVEMEISKNREIHYLTLIYYRKSNGFEGNVRKSMPNMKTVPHYTA